MIGRQDGNWSVAQPIVWINGPFGVGDAIETFVRREDAERFVEEVRGDDPKLASYLWIEQRELEAGGLN